MLRRPALVCLFATICFVDAGIVCAQSASAWPEWHGSFDPPNFPRGAGNYFSIAKIVASFVVFWLWIAMADWMNRDALRLKLNYRLWNSIICGSFFGAFLLMWVIPWFALSYTLLLAAAVAGPTTYVLRRNKPLHDVEKAFTLDHIKHVLLGKIGIKTTGKKSKEAESPIKLTPRDTTSPQDEQARLIAARQQKGYVSAGNLIHRAIQKRASAVMLDYTPEAAAVRFQIDGVWIDAEVQPRQAADPLLASLKALCGLKPEERRARQAGQFLAVDDAVKLKLVSKLTSQGTKTGERAVLQFDDPQLRKRRLPDLGLRQKLQEDLQELFKQQKGLIILAAAPGNGLTTLTTVCLSAVDRYTRTAMAVEDVRAKDVEVENVPVTTYDSLEQETPRSKLPGVLRQFPDVLVVPDYTDADTLKVLCDEGREERLVVTTVRAKDTAEALIRPLLTKVSPKTYALATTAVVASRLVRKLCEKCREAYPPPPQILQRLGITPDKVPAFYRPPTQPRQEVCPECGGLGYKGQAMLVEMLTMTDPLRQHLVQQPKVEAIRLAARKAGLKTFEDEGLLLVVKGVTSVQELARVLKEPAPTQGQAAT
jgi:type II secretory ATPase GspE/PulE/Tfp pilus assembly ATPase PilB-like protein